MTAETDELARRYAAALHVALADTAEGSLSSAYDLGRGAVRSGLSVLELAAMHNEALVAELRAAGDPASAEQTVQAGGAFFLESLSAYEMLQRVLREGQEQARADRRQAALLRRLSGFLGDASLAVDANASVQEVLQLVAEHALDIVDADSCRARVGPTEQDPAVLEAVASSGADGPPDAGAVGSLADFEGVPARAVRLGPDEVAQRAPGERFAWLAAPFTALDGRRVGALELYALGRDAEFSEVDEAVVVQLAQMASATFERMEPYRR
jgi:hypothetical protein